MTTQITPSIIHEDNHIIVVIKSQNIPTVADSSGDESLQEQLKAHTKSFVGIVHRLDRVTGGVMVFAKSSKAAGRLTEQVQNGTFKKTYLAVVAGVPKQREATLVNYLVKDEEKNMVSVAPQGQTGAKRAELSYKIVTAKASGSLVSIDLATGRSHQIRVQMKHIGNPIVGDQRYGTAAAGVKNIALWAHELSFVHPISGDVLKFVVNPPEDGAWADFDFGRKDHLSRGK